MDNIENRVKNLIGEVINEENVLLKTNTKKSIDEWINNKMLRCSGETTCKICGKKYKEHPQATKILTYYPTLILNEICDGTLAKL